MRWRSFVVLSITFFMLLLDFSIVNVALPAMESGLGMPQSEAQWVISTYAIALAGFLMLAGRCSDLYNRRTIFMAGLALFTVASLLGGFAPTPIVLIVVRAIQGIGAAIVTPSAMAILMEIYAGEDERQRVLGMWNTIGSAGLAAGVLVGGILTQFLGWRAVFFVNVPVGIIILILTPFIIPKDTRTRTPQQLDVLGAFLLTAGLVLAIFAIESIADRKIDWDTWVELAVAIALLVAFVFAERRAKAPLIPARLLRYENMVPGSIDVALQAAAYVSAFVFASIFYQRINHWTPLATGLAFLPSSLVITLIAGPLSAPLIKRIGLRTLGTLGGCIMAVGALLLIAMKPHESAWISLLPGTILIGLGAMFAYQVGFIGGLSKVSTEDQGAGSGMINTSMQAGISAGVAIAAALSTAYGLTWAFTISEAFALLTAFTCAFGIVSTPVAPKRHVIPMGKAAFHGQQTTSVAAATAVPR